MNIGQAAHASGISAKMIRHYESIGLIAKAGRTGAGYRLYSGNDVATLQFIRHARDLGFSLAAIRSLLGLWSDKRRSSAKVKALALEHLEDIDRRIRDLQAIGKSVHELAAACHGDHRPDCPILEGIAGTAAPDHAHPVRADRVP